MHYYYDVFSLACIGKGDIILMGSHNMK